MTIDNSGNTTKHLIKKISINNLPLACPNFNEPIIDKHPRIFLALTPEQPQIRCPYCSTLYILE